MSKNINQFVGHLITFDVKKNDPIVNADVLVEVVDFNNSGEVEVAFNDRNERCYLKFSLADLATHIGLLCGVDE